MIKRLSPLMLILNLTVQLCFCQEIDVWDTADSLTLRLPATAFHSLPGNISRYLVKNGYTIPQCWEIPEVHNVISGALQQKGRRDWAVLASKNRVSSILVFWGGSESNLTVLETAPDKDYLQGIGDGKIGFSRAISPVGKAYIIEHFRRYGGPKPPPIDHDGIDDAFVGKASLVFYYYRGQWLTLTGAD